MRWLGINSVTLSAESIVSVQISNRPHAMSCPKYSQPSAATYMSVRPGLWTPGASINSTPHGKKSHPKTVGLAQYGTLSIIASACVFKTLHWANISTHCKMCNEIYKGFNGKMLLLLKTSTDSKMMGLIGENISRISSYWKCGFDYLEDNDIYSQDWYDCQSWRHQSTQKTASRPAAWFHQRWDRWTH